MGFISTVYATFQRPWPRTSGKRLLCGSIRAIWPRFACSIKTDSCAGPSAPSWPALQFHFERFSEPGISDGGSCASYGTGRPLWIRCSKSSAENPWRSKMHRQRQPTSPQQSNQHQPSSGTGTSNGRLSTIWKLQHPAIRRILRCLQALSLYSVVLTVRRAWVETPSAREYANWDKVLACRRLTRTMPLLKEVSKSTAVFYTCSAVCSPRHLERDISKSRSLLHNAGIERARRYENVRTQRLFLRADALRDPRRNPDGYRSDEAFEMENAFNEQRKRSMRVASAVPDPTALLVIDEADRLKVASAGASAEYL